VCYQSQHCGNGGSAWLFRLKTRMRRGGGRTSASSSRLKLGSSGGRSVVARRSWWGKEGREKYERRREDLWDAGRESEAGKPSARGEATGLRRVPSLEAPEAGGKRGDSIGASRASSQRSGWIYALPEPTTGRADGRGEKREAGRKSSASRRGGCLRPNVPRRAETCHQVQGKAGLEQSSSHLQSRLKASPSALRLVLFCSPPSDQPPTPPSPLNAGRCASCLPAQHSFTLASCTSCTHLLHRSSAPPPKMRAVSLLLAAALAFTVSAKDSHQNINRAHLRKQRAW
jgi:hypothetical protein